VSSTAHLTRADDLKEDNRILLKDLRVLTVRARPQNTGVDEVTIRYYELATKSYDELVVACDQKVKVLCPDRCPICIAVDELI
jgi:hypothetical protein